MPTSPLLVIPHIVQGQNQKEVTANEAFDILESAIAETSSFDASGSGSISISDTDARPMIIELTGVLVATKTVNVPQRSKLYIIKNSTTGGFDVLLGTGIGIPIKLANGFYTFIYCDGTDCRELIRLITEHSRILTSTSNIEDFDKIIFCDTTTASFTVTLPATIPIGRKILIVKTVAANTLTIGRNGNTMNEVASDITINVNQQAIECIGVSATNWLAHRLAVA